MNRFKVKIFLNFLTKLMVLNVKLASLLVPKVCRHQCGNRMIKTFSCIFREKNEAESTKNNLSEEERRKTVMKKGLPKQRPIPGVKDILLVASGKGGVGKSTAAVNIALGLKELTKKTIGLLDADIFGPSIPKLMGIQRKPELNEDKAMIPPVNYGLPCMSMGFLMKEHAPVVWRGLMVMQAIQQLLWKVDWGNLDVLVVDMPPGTGDVPLSIIQNVPVTEINPRFDNIVFVMPHGQVQCDYNMLLGQLHSAVIITTPQDIALTDVRRGIEMFKLVNVPVLGVVQNMSTFLCPNCNHETTVFGSGKLEKFVSSTGTEILGNIPLHEKICDLSDRGTPLVATDLNSIEAQRFLEISAKVHERLCDLKALAQKS